MNPEYVKKIAELWQQVAEKKTLDPVDPKALKGKFSDRKDKDLDNDGDTDSSDEYLHKRRQAIKKNVSEENDDEDDDDDDNGEKMDKNGMKKCKECGGSTVNHDEECSKHSTTEKKKGNNMKKESVTHKKWGYGEVVETTDDGLNVYFEHGVEFNVPASELIVLEKNYATRTKGATPPEKMKDQRKGKGANDMASDLDADSPELAADDSKGHEDATKAGRAVGNQAPTRGQEKRVGDKAIVNPVKGAVTKTTGKEG